MSESRAVEQGVITSKSIPDNLRTPSTEQTPLYRVNRLLPSAIVELDQFLSGKETGKKPKYNFVHQIHSGEENANRAFEVAKNCDVICYEWAGIPWGEKESLSAALNMNSQGMLSDEDRTRLVEWLQGDEPYYLMIKFLNELKGSGKIFVLIDTC